MPYTHFRYIAYQVPTVARTANPPAKGDAIYKIPPGGPIAFPPKLTPALQGNFAGLGADAQNRVQRIIGAMLVAEEKLRHLDNNK